MSSLHSKTLFASFAVMAIVAAAFVGISMFEEDVSADAVHGSQSDPLTQLILNDSDVGYGTYYVLKGSQINVSIPSDSVYVFVTDSSQTNVSQYGLTIYESRLTGILSGSGSFVVKFHNPEDSTDNGSFTISIVQSSEPPINFTSPAAVDSVSGSSISYQATTNISGTTFTATGTGNASWLIISSSGLLSGTAPNVNIKTTYTYSIKATSPGGQSTVQKVTFEVYPVAKLSVTSSNVYETVGEPITPIVVNSNIACSLSLQNSNALTDLGLTWTASTGTISGTPTKVGSAVIKVLGSSTVGPSQHPSIEISITIREATLNITSEPPTGIFAVGKNYTYELTANQAVTWSISGNPSWLALTGSKVAGQVTGITEAGTISYTVTASTSGGQSVNQKVTINVEPTIVFTSVPTASCSVTPVYNYQPDGSWIIAGLFGRSIVSSDAVVPVIGALKDDGPVEDPINYTAPDAVSGISGSQFIYHPATNITGTEFSLVSGSAPWIKSIDNVITGTVPTVYQVTDYQAVIEAKSPHGQQITQTITITAYPVLVLNTSAYSTNVNQGMPMTDITVSSNVAVTWSKSGDLPAGITFSDGKFSGTSTESGTFPVTVYATSIEGPSQTAEKTITINVKGEPELEITTSYPTSMFLVGQQYSYTVAANVSNCTFALGSDKPEWAIIDGTKIMGQIIGYTDGQTVKFTVTATSPAGQIASQEISVVIEPVIAFTTVPTASCFVLPQHSDSGGRSSGSNVANILKMPLTLACKVINAIPIFDVPACDAAAPSVDILGSPVAAEGGSGGDSSTAPAPNITESGTRTFKFVWTGENAERVIWDFGDGKTGEGFQIVHTYEKNGTYKYTCTGINSIGQSSVSGTITVNVADDGLSEFVLIGIGIFLLIVLILVIRRATKRRNAGLSGRRR